jgi:hypothetical protein
MKVGNPKFRVGDRVYNRCTREEGVIDFKIGRAPVGKPFGTAYVLCTRWTYYLKNDKGEIFSYVPESYLRRVGWKKG